MFFLEMLGSEVDDDPDRGRNCCVQLIQRQERTGSTLDRLIRQGVPLREERYKWTEGDVKRLTEVALKLKSNTEEPTRPPTKPVIKYIRENVFGAAYGPTDDHIRKKLEPLRYYKPQSN